MTLATQRTRFLLMSRRLSQGVAPAPWPGISSLHGSHQAPPTGGEGAEVEARPSHCCQLVPTAQDKGCMWAEAGGCCAGAGQQEGRGLVLLGQV